MSTRHHSRKTARQNSASRTHKPYTLFRRTLRYEPLEDRRLLAVVTVTTLGDTINFNDGVTSLREAIFATNTVPGADSIDFASSLTAGGPATLLLTQGELAITDSLTITGPGANLLSIDASGSDPTPTVKDGQGSRVFNIDNGLSLVLEVEISGLTLKGGDVSGDGGAISSIENLTLTDISFIGNSAGNRGGGVFNQTSILLIAGSTFSGNTSRSSSRSTGGGGAVASSGATTIDHSTFNGNSAAGGGAIRAFGDLFLTNSAVTGNTATSIGGGISSYNTAATPNSLIIRDSAIMNNVASLEGGGVRQRYGSLLIERTTITGNKAMYAGGISAADEDVLVQIVDSAITANALTGFGGSGYGGGVFLKWAIASVVRSKISGNSGGTAGGGIYLQNGTLTIDSSTISGNSASRGGGVTVRTGFNPPDITVIKNSTVSGNTATVAGGGIYAASGVTTIEYSTITNNSAPVGKGSGVFARGPGLGVRSAVVGSSIIAGNINSDVDFTGAVAFGSLGYNVIGMGDAVAHFNQPGDQTGIVNPMLAPLADNGGPTLTHTLLAGSPAINAGDPAVMAGVNGVPEYDQRGTPFGRVFHGRIDIGAFEYQQASDLNLVVDTLVDELDGNYGHGDLSLREAIALTNLYPSEDTIRFDSALTAGGPVIILLTQGELKITDALSIAGPGANLLTVNAAGSDATPTLFDGKGSRIFNIDDGTSGLIDISLSGVRIVGGDSNNDGGAILNLENLKIEHLAIENNNSFHRAGAISHSNGSLQIIDVLVSQNASSFPSSGAVAASSGNVTVDASIFSGNTAAGVGWSALSVFNGTMLLTNSSFSGNTGRAAIGITGGRLDVSNCNITGNWGGISASGTDVSIEDSTISNNLFTVPLVSDTGGIVATNGKLSITRSTISSNSTNLPSRGGGVSAFNAEVTVTDTLFNNNSGATAGGMRIFGGKAKITHSIFQGNTVTQTSSSGGSGIKSYSAELEVSNCTITGNTGFNSFGIGTSGSLPILIADSMISGNQGGIALGSSGGSPTVRNVVISNGSDSGISAALSNGATAIITNAMIIDNKAFLGGGIKLKMTSGCTTSILQSEISGNSVFSKGGGVYSSGGVLLIDDSDIHDNSHTGTSEGGGGIRTTSTTTITNSRVFNNTSQSYGGGILATGRLTITGSDISSNSAKRSGGGIRFRSQTLINNSKIANNTASDAGGIDGNGPIPQVVITITGSTIVGNKATGALGGGSGGGILSVAKLQISESTIDSNTATAFGGGVLIISNTATIERTTISNNSAKWGGGISRAGIGGSQIISQSTISGNHAEFGGGVYSQSATIIHTTIAFNEASNTGGGIYLTGGPLNLNHVIVAQNIGFAADIAAGVGTTVSAKYSLVGNNTGNSLGEASVGSPDAEGNLVGGPVNGAIDPLLGLLADNGGPTLTHALLAGSPAINVGDSAAMAGASGVPLNDQRGVPFIRIYGGRIDVGAFELQPTDYVLGDFNRDGFVDAADYTLLRKQMGQTVTPGTAADANGDGVVNNADYLVWKGNFGVQQSQLQVDQVPAQAPVMGLSESTNASPFEQTASPSQVESGSESSSLSVAAQGVFSPTASQGSVRQRPHALRLPERSLFDNDGRWSDLVLESWRAAGRVDQQRFGRPDLPPFREKDSLRGSGELSASLDATVDVAFATF